MQTCEGVEYSSIIPCTHYICGRVLPTAVLYAVIVRCYTDWAIQATQVFLVMSQVQDILYLWHNRYCVSFICMFVISDGHSFSIFYWGTLNAICILSLCSHISSCCVHFPAKPLSNSSHLMHLLYRHPCHSSCLNRAIIQMLLQAGQETAWDCQVQEALLGNLEIVEH
jgi:hypothetical protein